MTVPRTEASVSNARPETSAHPLERLSADEIRSARALLDRNGLVTPDTRFALLALEEPEKRAVLEFAEGDPVERRVRAILLDVGTGDSTVVVASLSRGEIDLTAKVDPAVDGQPPILLDELITVDEIVKADEGWREAMARRGITDLDLVRPCPLSSGNFGIPGEKGRRVLHVLSFLQNRPEDHCWAHPIDGVVAYVDLIERRVIELIDHEVMPVPEEEGNVDDAAYVGPPRTTLKPIEITQPLGPSFQVDGDVVTWENWSFRIGFDPREGLVLHQICIRDGDRVRPLIYRASVAEMVVPYADPSPARFWQCYFDIGEYLLGPQVNSLRHGCDCLGQIHYFDAVVADGDGNPQEIPNAICLHEEDFGVLWKHTDIFTESEETRRQRRLVVSFFVTVGVYDYGFYWYLYLDGTIQLEVKATGVVFTSAYRPGSRYATEIAPGLGAPYHQHLYCARLDMMVDGLNNSVDEIEAERVALGPDNAFGNAFTRRATRLRTESEGARLAEPAIGRTWQISNAQERNRLDQPVAYELRPEAQPLLLTDPSSPTTRRATFATKSLWVTRYDPMERHPAGDLINQHRGGAGLPEFVAKNRSIDDEDIVLWHTFGALHFPRPEDWPVMPVDSCGFSLRPVGFFGRNPTLDVPAHPADDVADHCVPEGSSASPAASEKSSGPHGHQGH